MARAIRWAAGGAWIPREIALLRARPRAIMSRGNVMPTLLSSAPRDASLIRDLLYSALKREEDEIHQLGAREPIAHFLRSVADVPEHVVHHLLRKEALRKDIPIEYEKPINGRAVDFCFTGHGQDAALCEIKGAWNIAGGTGRERRVREPLQRDLRKLLELPETAPARRYCAWILTTEAQSRSEDIREWVKDAATELGELCEYQEAEPIMVNWSPDQCMRVVVLRLRRKGSPLTPPPPPPIRP